MLFLSLPIEAWILSVLVHRAPATSKSTNGDCKNDGLSATPNGCVAVSTGRADAASGENLRAIAVGALKGRACKITTMAERKTDDVVHRLCDMPMGRANGPY